MSPSQIFKTVHEFILSIALIVFILNAVFQFNEDTSRVLSLLMAILAQLILMDKKEWYASPDSEYWDEK